MLVDWDCLLVWSSAAVLSNSLMVERRSVYSGAEPALLRTHAVTGGGGGNARED